MTEDNELIKKREALKEQINQGNFKTLVDLLLDGIGKLLQKIVRSPKPVSIWWSALVLALATWSISGLVSLFMGEINRDLLEVFPIAIWLEVLAVAAMIAIKKLTGSIFKLLDDSIIDAITSLEDLDDLKTWLVDIANVKKHAIITLVVGLGFGGLLMPTYWTWINIRSLNFLTNLTYGPLIGAILVSLQHAVNLNYILPILGFPARVSRYDYRLYTIDPASSEIVDKLSDLLNDIVFISAVILVIFTAGLLLLIEYPPGNLVALALTWGVLVLMFLSGQTSISQIIHRTKWKTLNDIQIKIEKLRDQQEEIPSKDTLEHINALMDYHDRIRTTRNSAFDVRAGLSFLQSLLLPVFGLLLTSVQDIIEILKEFGR